MVSTALFYAAVLVALMSQVSAHIALWHPSMFGFNQSNYPTNRPQDPLAFLTFEEWWFHGHLHLPPHPDDIMQLPVGGDAVVELSCDKDATSWYASGPGGDMRDPHNPDYPCPRSPLASFHTNGINDLGGCALSVAYKSDANDVLPEDLVIFSVQQTCVWNLHTHFEIPADMPPCPNGKCICAWHWIHRPDSGSEQMFMNGFQCNFTGATSTKPLAKPNVARRCGAEPDKGLPARPWNCTYGAKSPLYWLQQEGNNMFEGYYSPPYYLDLYNFQNGAQNDIFEGDVIVTPLPPSPSTTSSTPLPTPGVVRARAAYADLSARDGEGTPPLHTAVPLPGYSRHYHKHKHTSGDPCVTSHVTTSYRPHTTQSAGHSTPHDGDVEGTGAGKTARRAWGRRRRTTGKHHS